MLIIIAVLAAYPILLIAALRVLKERRDA
jgi:hypothetical protein